MDQNTLLADNAERSLELLLAPYLDGGSETRARLSEGDVRQISIGLSRMGKDSWAKVPRLYAVLRMVDYVQVIDSFLIQGISDIWFPFSHKTLPESLRSASARFDFLRLQDLVLTKAFDLEREDGRHRHFSRAEDIPLQKLEELGKGAFGFVDRVLSTVTYKEYARKLIPRGKTFKKNFEVLRDFERELSNLKKMSHIHIVELVGSYTDPKFVGILMSPVADYNLKDFLACQTLSSGERSFLRTFFGCLANALCYLHENRIRHKDIKPQNVLVKGHQVFLTDFGISLDWSELGQSTTTGATVKTPRYCAPEVADYLPRNSLSDIWSLGCVFLEIWAVLKGETSDAVFDHLQSRGTKSTCYYLNCDSALEWCNILEHKESNVEENPPVSWIRGMLQPDQEQRWTAQTLVDRIQEVNENPDLRYAFAGVCCINAEDSTASDRSSKRSSTVLEETGASSVGIYDPRSSTGEIEREDLSIENRSASLTVRPSKLLEQSKGPSRSEQSLDEAMNASDAMKTTSSQANTPIENKANRPGLLFSAVSGFASEDRTQNSIRRKPVSRHISVDATEGRKTTSQDMDGEVAEPTTSHAHELTASNVENELELPIPTRIPVSGHSTLPIESSQVYSTRTEESGEAFALERKPGVDSDQRPPETFRLIEPYVETSNSNMGQRPPTLVLDDRFEPVRENETITRGSLERRRTIDGESRSPPAVPQPADQADAAESPHSLRSRFSWETENRGATTAATVERHPPSDQEKTTRHPRDRKNTSRVAHAPPMSASSVMSVPLAAETQPAHAGRRSFLSKLKSKFLDTSGRDEISKLPSSEKALDASQLKSTTAFEPVKAQNDTNGQDEISRLPIFEEALDARQRTSTTTLEPVKAQNDTSDASSERQDIQTKTTNTNVVKKCAHCQEGIHGQFVRALGGIFHIECFKCEDCGKTVASKFFPVDKMDGSGEVPLCETDYFRRLDLLCFNCGGALRGSFITALERKYHIEHFTCSVCSIVFTANDSYYEHGGEVYCLYHYSTQFAQRCNGCQTAILKQFVEIFRNGQDQHWHPECYMLHKFWNVRLALDGPALPRADTGLDLDEEQRNLVKEDAEKMEEKVHQTWNVLSKFEEQCATSISDILLHVPNGDRFETVSAMKRLIIHISILLRALGILDGLAQKHKCKGIHKFVVLIERMY